MKQRDKSKTAAGRIQSEELRLEVIHPDAAGIDIGNESHYVAVPPSRDSQPVQTLRVHQAELKVIAGWLRQCRIRTIAMQSTGVYWIAVYDILEEAGFEVYLVNARETKNLPGRKTDVQESQWLMKLHTYGLLRNSFRPPQEIRTMRTCWRQRNDLVQAGARHIQRIQKALTQMNIQLANVLSDVSGMTGQAIIKAILAGEHDPHKLAELRDPRVKASEEQVERSLEGHWQEDLLFVLKQEQDGYEFCHGQMAECDRRLDQYLQQQKDRSQGPRNLPERGGRSGPVVPDGRAPTARRQPRGAARARRPSAGYSGATLRAASCGQPGLCVQTAKLWSTAPGRRGAPAPGSTPNLAIPMRRSTPCCGSGRKARPPGLSGTRSTTGCASSRPSNPWSGTDGASSCSGAGNTSWRPMCQPTSAA